MSGDSVYIVGGSRPWNRTVFDEIICHYPGEWHFVASPEEMGTDWVRRLAPRYIFFLHWSSKVPEEFVQAYECVCFHMTDVPYGRGGSPLQNLILRGHRTTKLTALRMTAEFDSGPVYLKEELGLDGSAQEIYLRSSYLAAKMIAQIIEGQPEPRPQTGEAVVFKRRKPRESRIPAGGTLEELYDFVRMLDAEGYPRAFIDHGGFRYEFSEAELGEDRLTAVVTIRGERGDST